MELFADKISQFQRFYAWTLTQADKRVDGWFLMDAYTPTIVLSLLYVLITIVGPKLMEKREAVQMKNLLVVYNFVLVAVNFHIFKELLTASWTLNYSYSCQMVDYSDNPDEIRIAKALWWFYFSKLIEMLDTIFFILRKKNGQISFLHVYHHATMFPIWWIGVKWVAGGQSFFGAMVNSLVHVIMYTYYGISAMGPQYQRYLWWKRYLTNIQLIQFVCGISHATLSLYTRCPFPLWMQWALVFYAFSILCLFVNFYFHAYLKRRQTQKILTGRKLQNKVAKNSVANGHGVKNGLVHSNGLVTSNGLHNKKGD